MWFVVRQRNMRCPRFSRGQEGRMHEVAAVYNAEWKGSFRTICAEENREFYAAWDLYISFKRRLQRPWILHLGKQTIYPLHGPSVFLVLFFKSISERRRRFTEAEWPGGLSFWPTRPFAFYRAELAFRQLPGTCRKRNIMARHDATGKPLNWILKLN